MNDADAPNEKRRNFARDMMIAMPGIGEADVWPLTPTLIYYRYFSKASGSYITQDHDDRACLVEKFIHREAVGLSESSHCDLETESRTNVREKA
ncbi:hypothetical protein IAQ61_007355 [Plenodomus lingam]|uniref:uncharacterized protein n=1 Tax=Leptosphaeria maculans TaxID=5022 RepID=UPI00332D9B02|nr:hypothetical protein IAQ61_007355 [Plenodomus lingam]